MNKSIVDQDSWADLSEETPWYPMDRNDIPDFLKTAREFNRDQPDNTPPTKKSPIKVHAAKSRNSGYRHASTPQSFFYVPASERKLPSTNITPIIAVNFPHIVTIQDPPNEPDHLIVPVQAQLGNTEKKHRALAENNISQDTRGILANLLTAGIERAKQCRHYFARLFSPKAKEHPSHLTNAASTRSRIALALAGICALGFDALSPDMRQLSTEPANQDPHHDVAHDGLSTSPQNTTPAPITSQLKADPNKEQELSARRTIRLSSNEPNTFVEALSRYLHDSAVKKITGQTRSAYGVMLNIWDPAQFTKLRNHVHHGDQFTFSITHNAAGKICVMLESWADRHGTLKNDTFSILIPLR